MGLKLRKQQQQPHMCANLLYEACQKNDLPGVQQWIEFVTVQGINQIHLPHGNTCLHEAVLHSSKEIIQLLLHHYADRTALNYQYQTPRDLAMKTLDIQQLFQRARVDHRFVFTADCNQYPCCSLVNSFNEWQIMDNSDTCMHKANYFRQALVSSLNLKSKLYSIQEGYLNTHLAKSVSSIKAIRYWFQMACKEENPLHIIKAYTVDQCFSSHLNNDMARNVIHNLKRGCSKFSCDCLYSTEDATKSIAGIFLHHAAFKQLGYYGQVYRGMVLQENVFKPYTIDSYIITTTFLSTSKNPQVAQIFSGQDDLSYNKQLISCFCTFNIHSFVRTALDISDLSEFEEEDEVLLLPYTVFKITSIKQNYSSGSARIEIDLDECQTAIGLY